MLNSNISETLWTEGACSFMDVAWMSNISFTQKETSVGLHNRMPKSCQIFMFVLLHKKVNNAVSSQSLIILVYSYGVLYLFTISAMSTVKLCGVITLFDIFLQTSVKISKDLGCLICPVGSVCTRCMSWTFWEICNSGTGSTGLQLKPKLILWTICREPR